MNAGHVERWLATQPLSPDDIDCVIAVMLKILDGKCKMPPVEKQVMAALYDAVSNRPGQRFGSTYRALIAESRMATDEAKRLQIYELRVLAETEISRPVMKAFKARIRATGLVGEPPFGMVED
ncbi:MAG: hypothetical protein L6Q40_03480 [Azonexus sp.]|nr:hypothetical protein [Azonexus sp.]